MSGYYPTQARVVVGRTDRGGDLVLDLADAWHIAIQGQTRSGKSVLTYTMLSQLAYYPHVQIAGIDPTGILFAPLVNAPAKHLRASGAKDPANFKTVLQALVDEMDNRIESMLAEGTDKLTHFSPKNPLTVVVLEEFPGIMRAAKAHDMASGAKVSERIEPAISLAVGRLVSEGAKAGIRVVVLAQRLSAAVMDTDSRSQFGTRMSLRLDNSDAVKMLHESVDPQLLTAWPRFAPGVGVCDLTGDRCMFKADFIDYEGYRATWLERYPARRGSLSA